MTIERKVGMGIAGQPSDAPDVAEVFSTHLYNGNNTGQTITNGIDLAGEGGLVWTKARDGTIHHALTDTVRGNTKYLEGSAAASEETTTVGITAFNSNGYDLGADNTWKFNTSNGYVSKYVAWTFRKKEKFFDIVTWTGNSVNFRSIAHNLNGPIGLIIVKRTNSSTYWATTHKDAAPLSLNTSAQDNNVSSCLQNGYIPAGQMSDTAFQTAAYNGNIDAVNATGGTYVAYVFADNSSELADDQMIKCGNFTYTTADQQVSLGWEPQWLIMKRTDGTGDWFIIDKERGLQIGAADPQLEANNTDVEGTHFFVDINATGFTIPNTSWVGNNNQQYIYMAIRAPMMKEPEAATDVFSISTVAGGQYASVGFAPDNVIFTNTTQSSGTRYITTRLTGKKQLRGNTNMAEMSLVVDWDAPSGTWKQGQDSQNIAYFQKRAKGFYDVVAYSGTGVAHNRAHSLGVVPEMMYVKKRTGTGSACLYHKDFPIDSHIFAWDDSTGIRHVDSVWNDTAPTDSVFSVKTYAGVNNASHKYVAHLWATLAGISKVGSYTGNGTNQTISCGFSTGARYILIKKHQAAGESYTNGDVYIWDTTRGIIAGNDPHLSLNTGTAQITNDDSVDPANDGFIVNQVSATNINVFGKTYIFYAIA
tara:strand:- start:685 stop:2622 length:1938 start_codon:yes stop_codon:yes gene_type:complete